MAKIFQITLPEGMSNLKLNSQGNATVQYTVKNVSGTARDGRAVLVSLPQTKPPSGAVEKGFVKVDGKPERHFEANQEETFTVKIAVPPKSPAGNYTFRLDTVWVDQPDQGDPGGAVAFSVATVTADTKKFPLWIIPIILVVLIGIGVGVWFALRGGGGPKVPNVIGKTLSEADPELKAAGFTLDSNVQTVDSKPEDSEKIISTVPAPGAKAAKGQAIQATVGTKMVQVPLLIGHPFPEAQHLLSDQGLVVGQSTTVPNPNYAGGVVHAQQPGYQDKVKSGSSVDVQVTPQTVSVISVNGQTLGNAILTLQRIGLKVNEFDGDTTKTVINQTPAANVPVPVGSSVKLFFPTTNVCLITICRYTGIMASRIALEQGIAYRRSLEQGAAPPKP